MDPISLSATIQAGFRLIDKIIPDPQQKEAAKLALLQAEGQQALAEMQVRLSPIIAEAQSEDKFTSRARPGFMYVMYSLFYLCMIGAIIGIWHPAEIKTAAENMNMLFLAIPEELYNLFKVGFLGYSTLRTADKYIENKRQANVLKQQALVLQK